MKKVGAGSAGLFVCTLRNTGLLFIHHAVKVFHCQHKSTLLSTHKKRMPTVKSNAQTGDFR